MLRPNGTPITREQVEQIVRNAIALQLGINPTSVGMDQTLDSLGADFWDELEITMAIEDELGIELPEFDEECSTKIMINKIESFLK